MMGAYFSVCGLIFLSVFVLVYLIKKKTNSVETKIYGRLLLLTFFGTILEICAYLLFQFGMKETNPIYIFVTKMMLVFFVTWGTLFVNYVYAISEKKKITYNTKILYIINIIVSVIIFILKQKFIYMRGVMVPKGLDVTLTYIVVTIQLIYSIILAVENTKDTKFKKYLPIFFVMFLLAVSTIIQNVFPDLYLINYDLCLVVAIMYFTIENPDVKMLEQVEMARIQAEKASNAKTEFLSSMSHEIRTPLNAIVGFSDCIEQATTLDEAKENAKDIINASNTLLEIVNGVLDISKIEAGKLEINPAPYNSQEIFTEPAKLIKPRMEEKGLDFSYYIAPDIPETLYGDHANIKKIITNFLSNASKYTDKGYVKYEVNCLKLNDDVCRIIISVEDSGRGIKKENINKLFSKFDRLEETRNTTVEGTGLGLAITKQLVEMMNGKIMVHTIYGEGSKFTCMIDQRISKEKVKRKTKKVTSSVDFENIRILLVDDNELNIKVERKLLEKLGCNNVDYCYSGFECLEKNKSNTYDIILLDDMMPKMSGSETLKKLKENPNFKTPVVALTANAITGMRESYISQGFSEYIPKPIEKETLINVMTRLIDVTSNIEDPEEIEEKGEILDLEEPIPQEVNEPPKISDEDYLRSHGVDMDKALELLGDMEMYNETMKDFSNNLEERWSKLEQEKLSSDMENYAIDVHALKSDCKYLGFYDLADVAYEHELKSKENDSEYVNKNFEKLELEYSKVLKIVKEYTTRI